MSTAAQSIEEMMTEVLDASIRDVFKTMLGLEGKQIEAVSLAEPAPRMAGDDSAISVVMGWSGGLTGSITLTLSETSAIAWTGALLGQEPSSVDQDVVDAVGELANLVVGSTKSKLPDHKITMTLPVVIHAGLGSMGLQSNSIDLRMTYKFGDCKVTILTAIRN